MLDHEELQQDGGGHRRPASSSSSSSSSSFSSSSSATSSPERKRKRKHKECGMRGKTERKKEKKKYRRQLDEERAAKLARGTNKEGGKKSKKDKKDKKKKEKKRKEKKKKVGVGAAAGELEPLFDFQVRKKVTQTVLAPSLQSPSETAQIIPEERVKETEKRKRCMVPMTREEAEIDKHKIEEVWDEDTGRWRLLRGGEVIERIVSRDQHKAIGRQATHWVPRANASGM